MFFIAGKCTVLKKQRKEHLCATVLDFDKNVVKKIRTRGTYESSVNNFGEDINYIIPEKNCYMLVWQYENYGGYTEAYVRKEDIGRMKQDRVGIYDSYNMKTPPLTNNNLQCTDFWENWDICNWWNEDEIDSYKCECLYVDGREEFEEDTQATGEDGKVID